MARLASLPDRIRAKIQLEGNHWLWQGARNDGGYGYVTYEGRQQPVHRVVYRLLKGEIPDGLEIDHLCRVRLCVRPSHLEAVTHAENQLRIRRWYNSCRYGHSWKVLANVGWNSYNGQRFCRVCKREFQRQRRAATKVTA